MIKRIMEAFQPIDPSKTTLLPFTVKTGYVVTDDGDIVDLDGKPFAGTPSDEHVAIALDRKSRRALE